MRKIIFRARQLAQGIFKRLRFLKKLDVFLTENKVKISKTVSINEHSLEIFGEEKVFEKKKWNFHFKTVSY